MPCRYHSSRDGSEWFDVAVAAPSCRSQGSMYNYLKEVRANLKQLIEGLDPNVHKIWEIVFCPCSLP